MQKKIKMLLYVLIFSVCMVFVCLVYPAVEGYAIAQRMSVAPGGEMLLWLLPFMVVVAVDTAAKWRKGSEE